MRIVAVDTSVADRFCSFLWKADPISNCSVWFVIRSDERIVAGKTVFPLTDFHVNFFLCACSLHVSLLQEDEHEVIHKYTQKRSAVKCPVVFLGRHRCIFELPCVDLTVLRCQNKIARRDDVA